MSHPPFKVSDLILFLCGKALNASVSLPAAKKTWTLPQTYFSNAPAFDKWAQPATRVVSSPTLPPTVSVAGAAESLAERKKRKKKKRKSCGRSIGGGARTCTISTQTYADLTSKRSRFCHGFFHLGHQLQENTRPDCFHGENEMKPSTRVAKRDHTPWCGSLSPSEKATKVKAFATCKECFDLVAAPRGNATYLYNHLDSDHRALWRSHKDSVEPQHADPLEF